MTTPEEARITADILDDGPLRYEVEHVTPILRDLAAQVEALQADADRYRWLRDRLAVEDIEQLVRDF